MLLVESIKLAAQSISVGQEEQGLMAVFLLWGASSLESHLNNGGRLHRDGLMKERGAPAEISILINPLGRPTNLILVGKGQRSFYRVLSIREDCIRFLLRAGILPCDCQRGEAGK